MSNLKTIRKSVERDMMSVLEERLAEELGVDTVLIKGVNGDREWTVSFDKIKIDDHQITNVKIDQYSNLSCSIGKKFPVEYLPKFGRIVSELYPLMNYVGRPNYSLHVKYWKWFKKHITEDELKSMYKTGKGSIHDGGFKEWHKEYKDRY